jgi:hypothetical protein
MVHFSEKIVLQRLSYVSLNLFLNTKCRILRPTTLNYPSVPCPHPPTVLPTQLKNTEEFEK